MAIDQFKSAGSGKGLDVALGFAQGGPGGAALSLLKDSNPAAGSLAQGAMGRRAAAVAPVPGSDGSGEQDPMVHIENGIKALEDPGVPRGVRDAAAPVLFAAKFHASQGLPYDHLFEGQNPAQGTQVADNNGAPNKSPGSWDIDKQKAADFSKGFNALDPTTQKVIDWFKS